MPHTTPSLKQESSRPRRAAIQGFFVVLGFCVGCHPPSAASAGPADLAQAGVQFLETYCVRCHGVDFNTPGLDMTIRETMLGSDSPEKPPFLVPGKKEESRIYLHAAGLRQDKMPPEDEEPQPSEEEIELFGQWIDEGAAFPESGRPRRPFVGEQDTLKLILGDVEAQPEADRHHLRYFTLAHLWNDTTISDTDLAVARAAVSKMLNSLSAAEEVIPPEAIGDEQLVLRIDMRDYGWTERDHWLVMLKEYPYGLIHSDSLAEELYEQANSSLPYIRGDWFCFHASRPPLYHALAMLPEHVGLPSSQQRLETLLGVSLAADLESGDLVRAGMTGNRSGVSAHNRIVERHESNFGYYWVSYDAGDSGGRRNYANFPLGPKLPGKDDLAAFDHDGGEIIFSLPNGLQGYLLADATGARIDVGPPAIVQDRARHSGSFEIVNAISCMGCHRAGMISFTDSIRPLWEDKPGTVASRVRELYPKPEAMQEIVTGDAAAFAEALGLAIDPFLLDETGKAFAAETVPEPITFLSKLYDRDLDLGDVVRELSLPQDRETADEFGLPVAATELGVVIGASDQLRRLELAPLAAGEAMKRSQWEVAARRCARELGLGIPYIVQ